MSRTSACDLGPIVPRIDWAEAGAEGITVARMHKAAASFRIQLNMTGLVLANFASPLRREEMDDALHFNPFRTQFLCDNRPGHGMDPER